MWNVPLYSGALCTPKVTNGFLAINIMLCILCFNGAININNNDKCDIPNIPYLRIPNEPLDPLDTITSAIG
jgi:hypothetical protein